MAEPAGNRNVEALTTRELLEEVGRRLRLRFGKLEIAFHDGRLSPRLVVEHRVHRPLDAVDQESPRR